MLSRHGARAPDKISRYLTIFGKGLVPTSTLCEMSNEYLN